jgi:membrane protease subunit HflK
VNHGASLTSRHARRGLGLVALAGLAVYLTSGLFTVGADEQAVVRRFGRVAARVGPGIHYRVPWPVDRVDTVKTTAVMKRGVGFDAGVGDGAGAGMQIVTGDTNIINVAIVLQYVISNPAAFLFDAEDPHALIGRLAESALTETVVGMPVDEILTSGRLAIQARVKSDTQAILDRYGTGVQLTSANIMSITLDPSVAQAFQDVANAAADREKKINEARTYANNVIPKARGEGRSSVLAAQSYKDQRVAEAIGNSSRFTELVAAYSKAPDATRTRLYLEAMERVLPRVKKYVIDSSQGQKPVNLRLMPPQQP